MTIDQISNLIIQHHILDFNLVLSGELKNNHLSKIVKLRKKALLKYSNFEDYHKTNLERFLKGDL